MSKFKIYLLIAAAALVVVSCQTTAGAVQTASGGSANSQSGAAFDPRRVNQAYYASTRDEVQLFIQQLNQIIRARNFNAWRETLSQEYINEYSSPEKLREISEEPTMKRAGIVLRNLNDYFTRVFVPSRNPDRIQVDNVDIEFISEYRVRAFITRVNAAGVEQREILYNLEKINNSWKIIN